MTETVYSVAERGSKAEIIDFINYVFSQAHCPHNFKTLIPKVYGDDGEENIEDYHYIARQNGKIVGCVACRPTHLVIGGRDLTVGYVGSVSTHPYHRSEGHMIKLMALMEEEGRKKGYDLLILGGLRQRYAYYGFEKMGMKLEFDINEANVRHGMKDVDASAVSFRPLEGADEAFCGKLWEKQYFSSRRPSFNKELTTWAGHPRAVELGGKLAGYVSGGEIVLENEGDFPSVVKALFLENKRDFTLRTHLADRERIGYLSSLAENIRICPLEMGNVYSWKNVLEVCLAAKGQICPLSDADVTLDIEGDGVYRVEVKGGNVCVTEGAKAEKEVKLTHLQAQRLFFGISEGFMTLPEGFPQSFTQLPFFISEFDCF